jgi:O-antigen ligase
MIFFYALISVMQLMHHPFLGMFVGDLTMIKYLGACCFVVALLYLGGQRASPNMFQTPQSIFFLIFSIWGILAFLTLSPPIPLEISALMSCVSFLVLFFVTQVLVDSIERFKMALLVIVGSVAIATLYILREWQNMSVVYGLSYRPGWVTGDPNYYSVSALLCMPIAFYLMRTRLSRTERWFCLASLSMIVPGLALAASRGAFIGLGAGMVLGVARSRGRLRTFIAVTALFVGIALLMPRSPIDRFLSPSRGDARAASERMVLWRSGIHIFLENPVTGIGPHNFKRRIDSLIREKNLDLDRAFIAHNTYIQIGAEQGLVGLIPFLAVIVGTFLTLERVRRRSRSRTFTHAAAEGLQVGLVAYSVAILFLTAEYQKLFWLIVFLVMCLHSIFVRSQSSLDARPRTHIAVRHPVSTTAQTVRLGLGARGSWSQP